MGHSNVLRNQRAALISMRNSHLNIVYICMPQYLDKTDISYPLVKYGIQSTSSILSESFLMNVCMQSSACSGKV